MEIQMQCGNEITAYHVVADCSDVPYDTCVDDKKICDVFEQTARIIGAEIIGKSRYRFGSRSPEGCTVFLLLDESHISAHTYANNGKIAIDMFFSSSETKCRIAMDYIKTNLCLKNVKETVLQRFGEAQTDLMSDSPIKSSTFAYAEVSATR
jgi:S-adenosylmethionine decarboxylase